MPFPKNIDPRVWTLTNALCDGSISEKEMRELELLLNADISAREFYIDFLNINAEILWLVSSKQHSTMDSGPPPALPPLIVPHNRPPILGFLGDFFNQHSLLSFVMFFVIFGVTLLATTYWLSTPQSGKVSVEPEFVAQITVTKDCQWSTTIPPPAENMPLKEGRQLQLEKGIAQITYSNGAVVLIEGPASFTVDSPNSGLLSRGKLTARADTEKSRQFTILTSNARFVDLGTEFGVMIDDLGRAAVAVFAGKVNAEAKLADGRWTTGVSLHKGEAVVCEGAKFTPQVAQRSNFPTLQPLPPPPPQYQHWLDASRDLQRRQDLLAYYDFQPDPNNPRVLLNRAMNGAALNGEIQNATWAQGRFAEKSALKFTTADAGVRVNLPGKYQQMSFITWVNINRLANNLNGLLLSNDWSRPGQLHWELQSDAHINMNILNKDVHKETFYSKDPMPADCFNRWCMIAGVIDIVNKRCSLYIDGKCVSSQAYNAQIPAIEIGAATIAGWLERGSDSSPDKIRNLLCRMDELMIFQTALSAEEMQQIYEAGKP